MGQHGEVEHLVDAITLSRLEAVKMLGKTRNCSLCWKKARERGKRKPHNNGGQLLQIVEKGFAERIKAHALYPVTDAPATRSAGAL